MGNAISDIQLWIICVISQIDGKTSGVGDIMTRELKSTWSTAGASFLSFSKALCVCQSRICSVSPIYCCLSSYTSIWKLQHVKVDHIIDCVLLPAHIISRAVYTQFVRGLIGSEACRIGSRGGRLPAFLSGFHCVCFAPGGKILFEEGVFTSVPRSTCPASAEVERWLCSWESQMDQMEGMKTGEPLSSSFPFRSSAHSLRSEARPAVLPPGERARCSACRFPRRGTGRTSMSFHKR